MSPSCWNLMLVWNSGSSGSDSSAGSESTLPGSDSSSTCWHLCWQPPWPWRGRSSGIGSPLNSSFSLLTRLSRGPVTINTADKKAKMKQSHPKSWIPHLSGDAAALTVGCPLQPKEGLAGVLSQLPGKQPSIWENWSSSGEKTTQFCCFCWSWLREWSRAYSIIYNNHYHSGLNSYLLWFYHHVSQYQTGYC